jgi:U32 family peptidase
MELIAPAGDWDCVKAAVEHGADAVYFGLQSGFNARARAVNFAPEQLSELTAYLRRRGAKGYVTLNTLVFPGELEEMERTIRTVAAGGVDAAIVQDLGVARLMREVCPTLPIHASTQMTLSSAACIAAVAALGIQRVVLPRELSIDQIALLRRGTDVAFEVFVHGAMCLSYSGQCLASAAIGGRSANRGQCAQPCRLPYELICDGRHVDLGDCRYLLSPHDLAAYDLLPQLLAAGVDALKIEGRLKSAEYVANVTQHYRQALDREVSRFSPGGLSQFSPGGLSQFSPGGLSQFSPERKRDCPLPVALDELELSFSRGFSHGWLEGRDHKALVSGRGSAKRGVLLGRVRAVRGRRVAVELVRAVARGDGLMFETGRGEQAEQGGRVYEIFREGEPLADAAAGGTVELAFGHDAIDMEEIRPGQQVWMTDDAALTRRLRKSFSGGKPKRRVALDLLVEAAVGQPLRITAQAASGAACRLQSPQPLETAVKHPLTSTLLGEQLGRLGSTVYELRHLEARIDGQPMIPLSVLGKLRHEMLRLLDEAADRPPIRPLAAEAVLERLVGDSLGRQVHDTLGRQLDCRPPELHVLCRSLRQLQAVLACGAKSTIVDLADLAQYEEAVRNAHAAGAAILLATPRIQKPGEEDVFSSLASLGADGILARNLAGLAFFSQQGVNVVADFSLNAANQLTVAWLREQGASRVTASYDLDRGQLLDLVAAVPPECLEVVVHQHMPMFHTEHCVFCTTLSAGESEANCGRLCKKHAVRLRDRLGVEHPLRADATCRNTLFHAVPQSAAEIVPLLVERGVRHFRVELLDDADPPDPLLEVYGGLLAGQLTGSQAWGRLQELHPAGLTRGTLR